MKKLLVISISIFTLLLVGCDNPREVKKDRYSIALENSKGLEDCKDFRLNHNDGTGSITVIRCPNSSTTTEYLEGKYTETTVVIDGVEYVKKQSSSGN